MDITNLSPEDKQKFQENLDRGSSPINSVPTPIATNSLAINETPVVVPPVVPTVSPAVGIISSAQASSEALKQAEAEQAKLNAPVAEAQKKTQSTIDLLREKFGMASTAQQDAIKAETAIEPERKALNEVNTQIADYNVQYRAEQDRIQGRGDISKEAQQGLKENADMKYGRILSDLAIRQSAANQNITALQAAAERKLNLTLAPLQTEIDFLTKFQLENDKLLTQEEKAKIASLIAERDKIVKTTTEKEKGISDLITEAMKVGRKIPDSTLAKMLGASSLLEATSIAQADGVVLTKPTTGIDIGGVNIGGGNLGSVYASALANASLGLPENQRVESMARLKNYLAQGDTKSAKELIIRSAFAGQTGTQKEDTIKRQNAVDALGTIKTALDEYVAKSGDTNIIKGNLQSLKQKLGSSGDPELAAIGTKITLALQQYRNAVTGAAWGEQETDEYEQIFPSYKNSDKLNGAIIDAMRDSMGAYQESTLSAYIGGETYKQLFTKQPAQGTTGGAQTSNANDPLGILKLP